MRLYKLKHLGIGISLTIVAICLAGQVFAQESGTDKADEDLVFELSPFRVDTTSDIGYLATNATSGTRLNTAIKDLPMSLEVVTSEFIEDIGATDLKESLAYSAGISTVSYIPSGGSSGPAVNTAGSAETSPSASGSVGDYRNNALSIRGFNVPFQQRMGFRVGTTVPNYGVTLGALIDSVNVERNEILRGPGALLYGIGVISGIVNVHPKKPTEVQKERFTVGVGSDDYKRATGDISGPLKIDAIPGQLNYRLAAAFTEEGDWTDYFLEDREYYVAQIEYRPIRKLSFFLEYQMGETRFEGIGQQYLFDNLSGANDVEYRNEFFEQFNWGKTYGNLPDSHRVSGPDTWYERDEDSILANIEFSPIQNLNFNVGYFLSEQEAEEFTVSYSQINNGETGGFQITRDWPLEETLIHELPVDPNDPNADPNDYKVNRYWWVLRPQAADTEQVRVEVSYSFETPWFGDGTSEQNFLFGYHSIEDDVDFHRGRETAGQIIDTSTGDTPVNENGDAYYVRSFWDFSPLRYNGEVLAQPGSNYYSSRLWYAGFYGVYQGKFFEDRLQIIAGLRQDRYQAFEERWQRVQGDPTNTRIGTEREGYNFEEAEKITSATFAASFRITDHLSMYGLMAEGVAPNTGQQDGAGNFIPPEETSSNELGLKFDFYDGRISGTIAAYQIERVNATWTWRNAPDPRNWAGGPNDNGTGAKFDPERASSGELPISYGVDLSYFTDPATQLNWPTNADGTLSRRPPRQNQLPDGVLGIITRFTDGFENGIEQTVVYLDYNKLDEAGYRDVMETAFADSRSISQPDSINPIVYRPFKLDGYGNNPSNWTLGQTVTFVDEAEGVDVQLILSPLDNWQIVLNYAHTERSAKTGFQLVDAADVNTGVQYGTEYDIWVRDLGRESFEDPTQASTATGGGVQGLSLYFGPEDMFSIWSNYKIKEGFLAGLELGAGVIYVGPAQTSIPIGGTSLVTNLYATPDTKERYQYNAALTYKKRFTHYDFRISLNVYNIFDEDYLESRVTYENVITGEDERRRSYYRADPFSFRLTATFDF